MIIAIDFDGTVVDHRYPNIGPEAPYAVCSLKQLCLEGDSLILFTMRSNYFLGHAIEWFNTNGIDLWGIQWNPEQHCWSQSNKCYAQVYIDDAALGCPLIHPEGFHRPCVDWVKVMELLKNIKDTGCVIVK